MRHGTSQVAVLVENNTIRARALATIKLGSICHNWKLQIGWWDSEWKTLIIVLGVRIAVAPDGLTVLVVSTARAHRIVDVILGIVVIAAGSTVGLACENIGGLWEWGGQDCGAQEAEEQESLGYVSAALKSEETVEIYFN
jgi:hypothetical protein